ncbi:CDF family zinc transporter ZitB [Candidatus Fukatsuia symbiotica]|uniref:Zinc transporter ZitB n=1 Tax=Candidatus Fukatsuia symbiotica TaxID=1878942 RepID=A0A2U8I3Q2_9GAMM|nr:CDF family zinc transporter ZitB [Candidatus Fukatsuia symbiotica]AWK13760.1 cation transporter [Candidatus Fukatsuia symbiotica]MEA9445942.1 CDF family zinc transporter ZitB [Candidatus Fukatsuia symbiotica]
MANSSFFLQDSNSRRLLIAFIITTLFMVAEVIGGLLSSSLALLADAGHMVTDAMALLLALVAVHFAQRKPNMRHTFGYLRLTTVAAFVNAGALFLIVLLIVWEAMHRFVEPHDVLGVPMLIVAIAGFFANLFSFWILHRGTEEKNINVRAATLHILGDLLGSVGAIVAAIVILMTGWTPIDPILSILVSVLVLRSAWRLLKESFHELLEGAPHDVDIDKLRQALCTNIDEVRDVHHVHLWQAGEQRLMTLHVQVAPPNDHDDLLQRIQQYLLTHYNIAHATIQTEYQHCKKADCDIGQLVSTTCKVHHH